MKFNIKLSLLAISTAIAGLIYLAITIIQYYFRYFDLDKLITNIFVSVIIFAVAYFYQSARWQIEDNIKRDNENKKEHARLDKQNLAIMDWKVKQDSKKEFNEMMGEKTIEEWKK